MGAVADAIGDGIDSVGNAVGQAGEDLSNAASWVDDEVLQPVATTVVNTVNYALENPVDAAVMVVAIASGQWWAVPSATAAITVSHGGSVEDAAKAAAVAYATQEFMSGTQVGQDISAYTGSIGAEAGAAASADAATAAIVSKGVTSALNQAVIGGMRSVLTGQDISSGITNGLLTGAAFGSTEQLFANLSKDGTLSFTNDPKLNEKIAKSIGAASGIALGALVTDKDPAVAVGNYLAYKMMQTAGGALSSAAKSTFNDMKSKFASVEESQKTFLERQDAYNKQFADLDKRQEDYNAQVDAYQKKVEAQWGSTQDKLDAQKSAYDNAIAKYKEQEKIYNNTSLQNSARNDAADKMAIYAQQSADASKEYDRIFNENKSLYDSLTSAGDSLKDVKKTLDADYATLQNTLGKDLTNAKNVLETQISNYNQAKAVAEDANEKYTTQLAESVTRDVAIDAINNGIVSPTKTNEDGSVTFDNGITLKTDGTMYQGDNQLFTAAKGVEQNDLKFSNEQGKNYWFDSNANRLASDTDIQDVYKNNYGLNVTPDEAMKFAGSSYSQADNENVKNYAIDKIGSEFEKYGYKAPDDSTLKTYIEKGGDTIAKADAAIDPYYVDTEEAKNFVRNSLGREATPEEIAMLVGAKNEATALNATSADQARVYDTLTNLFGTSKSLGYADSVAPFDVAAWEGYSLGQQQKDPLGLSSEQKQQISSYLQDESKYKDSGIYAADDGTYRVNDYNNQRSVIFSADGTYLGSVRLIGSPDDATSDSVKAILSGVGPMIDKLPTPAEDKTITQLFSSNPNKDQQAGNFAALFGDTGSGSSSAGGAGTTNDGLWNGNIAIKREYAGSGAEASNEPLYTIYGATRPNIIVWQDFVKNIDPELTVKTTADGKLQITSTDPTKPVTQKQIDKVASAANGATGVSIATDSKVPSQSSADEAYRSQFLSDFIKSMSGSSSSATPSGSSPALINFPASDQSGSGGSGTTSGGTTTTGSTTGTGTGGTGGTGSSTSGTGTTTGGTGTTPGTGTGTTGTGTGSGSTGTGSGSGGTGSGTGGTGGFGDLTSYMTGLMTLGSGLGSGTTPTPLKPSFLTSKDPGTKFEGALQQFQQFASKPFYDENTYADQFVNQQQTPQEEPQFMNTPYYNYGELDNIEDILNPQTDGQQTDEQQNQYAAQGGLMAAPLMAAGGMTGTRHGQYAHGGLSTPIVHHSGKARVDFRHGDAVTGAGDGQSDDIPAMLADGEFVFPADVVAAIGNGSTKAGSDKLYDMMHGIRAHVRSAKPKDLPPEVKSPLDFLKTKPKKARR